MVSWASSAAVGSTTSTISSLTAAADAGAITRPASSRFMSSSSQTRSLTSAPLTIPSRDGGMGSLPARRRCAGEADAVSSSVEAAGDDAVKAQDDGAGDDRGLDDDALDADAELVGGPSPVASSASAQSLQNHSPSSTASSPAQRRCSPRTHGRPSLPLPSQRSMRWLVLLDLRRWHTWHLATSCPADGEGLSDTCSECSLWTCCCSNTSALSLLLPHTRALHPPH